MDQIVEETMMQKKQYGKMTMALIGVAIGFLFAATVDAENSVRQGPTWLKPSEHLVGRMVPDMELTDIENKRFRLSDLADKDAVVLAFTNTSCPISKKYAPTLAALEKAYSGHNVAFVFVNPTSSDKPETIRKSIQTHGFQGRYVTDSTGVLASAVGATHTTDMVLLDSKRTILYRGAVDDQYGFGYSLDSPRKNYLIDALEAKLKDKTIEIAATSAPGCPLDLNPTIGATASEITYHNRISRIVQASCLECHRDGGVAPFSLATYEDVVGQSGSIRHVLEENLMPPWFAAKPSVDFAGPFANDCSLSQSDKDDFLAWIQSRKPEGDFKDAPAERLFHDGWQIGKPDRIIRVDSPIAVKATGTMPYKNVYVDTGLTETKYLKAIEVRPSAREVVHHILVFVVPEGAREGGGRRSEAESDDDDDEGTNGFFAAYAPGYDALVFNEGFGKVLPAGSRLKFQIHYTPNGTATTDQPEIGLIFLEEKPEHLVDVVGVSQLRLAIPPRDPNFQVIASQPVPSEATILAFFPHMHLRGKAFRYEAILPDGTEHILLDVPRYDFNWQLSYRLANPVTLPAGSTIRAIAHYDNSEDNPANPDPNKTVRWGPQTDDEMMIGYIEYHMEQGSLGMKRSLAGIRDELGSGKGLELIFKRLDKNADGKLSGDEIPPAQKERLLRLDRNKDGSISLEEAKALTQFLRRQ
jgi:peroxiredoxin